MDVDLSNHVKISLQILSLISFLSTLIILLVIVFIWINFHYLLILAIHLIHPFPRCYNCLNHRTTRKEKREEKRIIIIIIIRLWSHTKVLMMIPLVPLKIARRDESTVFGQHVWLTLPTLVSFIDDCEFISSSSF
jgi:hypothetical protein